MILFIIAITVVLVLVFRAMTPEERTRLTSRALASARQVKDAATHRRPELEEFREALDARARRAIVVPAIVALNVATFVFMLFGAGALADPNTLVAWGGNFGPRTTNGEWWRFVTAMFVHAGMLHLLVNLAGVAQIGLLVERLVGPAALAGTYLAAGALASLVNLSTYPVGVTVGASGAIFGIYGLLVAWLICHIFQRATITIPARALQRLVPAAILFIIYNLSTDSIANGAALAGCLAGFACGLAVTIRIGDREPPVRRLAALVAATVAIVVASAVPLRGLVDVRPEIARIVASEDRMASTYEEQIKRFRNGKISADALAALIDRTMIPELQGSRARLKALDRVPQEHQPMVASADEYLRMREESWRVRAEGLRKSNMRKLGQAERVERVSLEALQRIRPVDQK